MNSTTHCVSLFVFIVKRQESNRKSQQSRRIYTSARSFTPFTEHLLCARQFYPPGVQQQGKKRDQGTPSWDWHCSRRETPNKQKLWCRGLTSIRKKSRSGEGQRQGRGGSAAGPSRPEWRQAQGVWPPSVPSRAEVSKKGEGGDTFSENSRAASEAAVQGEQ